MLTVTHSSVKLTTTTHFISHIAYSRVSSYTYCHYQQHHVCLNVATPVPLYLQSSRRSTNSIIIIILFSIHSDHYTFRNHRLPHCYHSPASTFNIFHFKIHTDIHRYTSFTQLFSFILTTQVHHDGAAVQPLYHLFSALVSISHQTTCTALFHNNTYSSKHSYIWF